MSDKLHWTSAFKFNLGRYTQGVMGIRGSAERQEYISKWEEAYHFRLLYRKPYFFPIYGALRKGGAGEDWELYKKFGRVHLRIIVCPLTYLCSAQLVAGCP